MISRKKDINLIIRNIGEWLHSFLPDSIFSVLLTIRRRLSGKREYNYYRIDIKEEKKKGIYDRYNSLPKCVCKNKRVSVIVPNYNHGKYLRDRIGSILNQDYQISELIFLDDCSQDHSVEIAKNLLKDVPLDIKIVINEKNSGSPFAQWEKGISEADGEYIWIAESDDACKGEFLSTAMKGFEDDKVILSMTESELINENGEITCGIAKNAHNIYYDYHWDKSYINNGIDEIRNYLSANNSIINVSAVVWRNGDVLKNAVRSAKNYSLAGDWYTYCSVLKEGDIAFSNKVLNQYRCHANTIREKTAIETEIKDINCIQELCRKEYALSKKQLLRQRRRLEIARN